MTQRSSTVLAEPSSTSPDTRPRLSEHGHVLVVTESFPPVMGGSSVVMQNLLSRFDPRSFTVASIAMAGKHGLPRNDQIEVETIVKCTSFSSRLNNRWKDFQIPFIARRLVRIIKARNVTAIVGVYPDMAILEATQRAAKDAQIPWITYLHDTVEEANAHRYTKQRATLLESQIFSEASHVFVMSRGLADLYRGKHGVETEPLQHSYLDEIPSNPPEPGIKASAFWAGGIYAINSKAVRRVSEALASASCPFLLTTNMSDARLSKLGLLSANNECTFFKSTRQYLDVLRSRSLLVLALDSPEESPIHRDELATIFPTKTPEYLATGRPILVHCPQNYFLAEFFQEHQCGLVVTDPSKESIASGIKTLLSDSEQVRTMQRNALKTAQMFQVEPIAERFKQRVDRVSQLAWSEKLES